MTTMEVPIGARVQVTAGVGVVRWVGSNPPFAAGKWVGVELEGPTGKNNGSVKGEKFFQCKENHGVFVRPSQVKILEAPAAAPTPARAAPPTPRAGTMRPPPTPVAGARMSSTSAARVSSPQKPAAASTSARASSGPGPSTPPRIVSRSSAASAAGSPPTVSRRPSATTAPQTTAATGVARPPSAAGNIFKRPPSVAESTASTSAAARAPTPSTANHPHHADRAVSPVRQVSSPLQDLGSGKGDVRPGQTRSLSSVLSPTLPPVTSPREAVSQLPASRPASPDKDTAVAAFAHKRELEELRIKVRILESRKAEDQERIKSLESKVGEADALRAARVKLQAKFQELQSSLVSAQRQARDLQSENTHLETRATEALDQLEMAALDREVAEEKAEAAEAELAKLNEKISELELEVAVLQEENAEYEKPVGEADEGKSSLAFVQLEKHNERLKEALIRLRDVSTEAEREHKAKISDLERELTSQEELTSQLELAEAKLANAEAQVEDLKLQLDDALGAEDMLEQLTDRNLQLSERLEEMRVAIEDLEALKELNDELEENHVEAEKQLNEEIDNLTGQLRDERSRSADLDGVVLDMEATILQFRELVAGLQSEIDTLRVQQATQEFESASTSKEAQALLNLNLKLQSTATKAQSKTIDLELKRLEASQLAEHMKIVTAYLPDPYHETDADSTTLYLFFRRLSYKSDLLINVMSQIHGLPNSLHTATSEVLVGACELRGRLRHFSTLNKRFGAVMCRTGPDEWVAYGKVLAELAGVEQRVDGWIEMAKADEFNEGECARELGSLVAQFDHLAATTFDRPQLDAGEVQLGLAYSFDHDLDNFAAAVGFARQAIVSFAREDDVAVEVGESSLEEGVYEPVQRILDQVRAAKVPSSKLVLQIEEVVQGSTALLPDVSVLLSDLAASVSNAVDLAVQLAQRIAAHVAALRASKQPLRLEDIDRFLVEITAQSTAASELPPWEQIGMFVSRLGADLGVALPKIRSAVKSGQTVSMDVPPPWLARVAHIKAAAQFNVDTERKVVRLSEELKDMLREIKLRDQSLQESGVKVETLERRLEATRKQADLIIELENDVAKAKKQEKVYEEAIEQLQAEQDALEAENARLRKGQGTADRQANASMSSEPLILAGGQLESAQAIEQIENLRSAIRYLRNENSLLKSKELYHDLHVLPALPYRSSPEAEPAVPELDPSSALSSPSSSLSDLPMTPTRHWLETEGKLLFREITAFQTRSKIVDISSLRGDQGWVSRKRSPEVQVWEWKEEGRRLERKVEGLADRMRRLAIASAGHSGHSGHAHGGVR